MPKKTRRRFTSQEKVGILRLHLLEQTPISGLCDRNGVHPMMFYRWQAAVPSPVERRGRNGQTRPWTTSERLPELPTDSSMHPCARTMMPHSRASVHHPGEGTRIPRGVPSVVVAVRVGLGRQETIAQHGIHEVVIEAVGESTVVAVSAPTVSAAVPPSGRTPVVMSDRQRRHRVGPVVATAMHAHGPPGMAPPWWPPPWCPP